MNHPPNQGLKHQYIGTRCLYFDEVDSSNDEAFRQYAKTPQSGLVVIARQQSKARGRLGRTWHTEPDKSLAISIALSPPIPFAQWAQLTLVAGLALQQTLVRYIPQAKIKWPNDILVQHCKLAGILTESRMRPEHPVVVIGIGINIYEPNQGWPKHITQPITALSKYYTRKLDTHTILIELLQQLDHWYGCYLQHGFTAIREPWWKAHHASQQQVRAYHQGKYIEGIAVDLAQDGSLLLQSHSQLHRIISGEIEIL